jgi:hypothetical protein
MIRAHLGGRVACARRATSRSALPHLQTGSAVRTPQHSSAEGRADRAKFVEMVCACPPVEVVSDGGHDELCTLGDGDSVTVGVDGAGSDDLTSLQFLLSVAGGAVVVAAICQLMECPVGCRSISMSQSPSRSRK